ncbi:hypothetical protein SCP_1403560 [Sparassis crispa]|uniref:Hydrophobin n=1 Tax=Sparassis crispa TaxID=139825 RepID=A0A401H3E4_9APHY|nr:hypothetical protein SCP_1403560 [Sparassis crispa]GBE88948.1 hypothetical protein SCP_1403560 [Sparassis crispa]
MRSFAVLAIAASVAIPVFVAAAPMLADGSEDDCCAGIINLGKEALLVSRGPVLPPYIRFVVVSD